MVCIVVVMYKFVCWFGCVVVFGLMFVGLLCYLVVWVLVTSVALLFLCFVYCFGVWGWLLMVVTCGWLVSSLVLVGFGD